MSVLLELLVVLLVFGAIFWIVENVPMPPTFKIIARILVAIIAIVALLSFVPGMSVWRN